MTEKTLALAIASAAIGALALALLIRRAMRRAARRAVHRFRARVNRFKLTRRSYIKAQLLADPAIAEAVRAHAHEHELDERDVWKRVDGYIDEIVPYFNILAYYSLGYAVSRVVLNLLYKVSVDYEDLPALERLPDDSVVIYLANHRSNADYVLLAYVLAGDVSISYAVGEWARAFPLEYVFKSFGSYFIRRRYREPLYHGVLERYVQLITRNGVTQGIFPEGGLTRDGRLRPAKIGLLDYALGVAREPAMAERMVIIPVAINYDRVLEDRSLLRELARTEGGVVVPRLTQLREVARYVGWNLLRMLGGRWKRYGRAAVTIGRPLMVANWLLAERALGIDPLTLARPERLARVQSLCDDVMSRIGAVIPVTPVPLACAAIQSLESDFVSRRALLERMAELRAVLLELNARVLRADRDIEETFERAWRMLSMRRILAPAGDGYAVLPGSRVLVSYYANSIAHLLGPFAEGVRERDALPVMEALR
ncbi:MAG TPA: 1-acyl-sn-glycerol-3-phosphate acyltransferase [Gemmatimonadaceae bacterium]|nr:1-acyl-sn-glycerol-3-phosphate acyltransferase [Gemmatimonadaceae bacterium]